MRQSGKEEDRGGLESARRADLRAGLDTVAAQGKGRACESELKLQPSKGNPQHLKPTTLSSSLDSCICVPAPAHLIPSQLSNLCTQYPTIGPKLARTTHGPTPILKPPPKPKLPSGITPRPKSQWHRKRPASANRTPATPRPKPPRWAPTGRPRQTARRAARWAWGSGSAIRA